MERGPHTKIKLKLVGNYLTACSDVHASDPSKFTYFETHAGDGLTVIDGEEIDGSPVIAANRGVKVVAMDIDPEKVGSLKDRLKFHGENTVVFRGDVRIADDVEELLSHVPAYYHSMGSLDPEGPGQLPFSSVDQILQHSYTYVSPPGIRRPELLINFPLKRIKQNAGLLKLGAPEPDEDYEGEAGETSEALLDINDAFFGGTDWRDEWLRTAHDSQESRIALLNAYLRRISPLYPFPPRYILVSSAKGAPLYYLIFFTARPLGDQVFESVRTAVENYQKERWVRENLKIMFSLEEYGGNSRLTTLDEFGLGPSA